jgi:kynureninase
MMRFLRHSLALTASVQGQLALLVRLQWIAGKRVAEVMSAAPFSAVIVLTHRICWFDMGAHTNAAQHHHAWVVFDHAHPVGQPPALLYA